MSTSPTAKPKATRSGRKSKQHLIERVNAQQAPPSKSKIKKSSASSTTKISTEMPTHSTSKSNSNMYNVILFLNCTKKDLALMPNSGWCDSNVPIVDDPQLSYSKLLLSVDQSQNDGVINNRANNRETAPSSPSFLSAQPQPSSLPSSPSSMPTFISDFNSAVAPVNESVASLNEKKTTVIARKMQHIRNNLSLNKADGNSDCFWDGEPFQGRAIYIPKYLIDGVYRVYGCFCCIECAAAFLKKESLDDSVKTERLHLLHHVYGQMDRAIVPAISPHYITEKYYGTLTINEYRAMIQTGPTQYYTTEKPLTRVMPELFGEFREQTQRVL